MLKRIIKFLPLICILPVFIFQSCGKKEEPQTFVPPQQETSVDKDKEQKEREEFERLKKLQEQPTDSVSIPANIDSVSNQKDTSKTTKVVTPEKKKFVQKEKELNKRLDNPKTAISDYMEFLQRGTSEGGNFEQNMKKASDLWETRNIDRFKSNYKNTKKITILEEPKVISRKGNEAVVEVKIRKTDFKNKKNEETEMTIKYNLTADSKGKWKIKDNTVIKK